MSNPGWIKQFMFKVCSICVQSGLLQEFVLNWYSIRVQFELNWWTSVQSVFNPGSICVQSGLNTITCVQPVFDPCSIWVHSEFVFNLCSIRFVTNLGSIMGISIQFAFNPRSIHVPWPLDPTICVQFVFNLCSIKVKSASSCSI
jgi:hypothetical protein